MEQQLFNQLPQVQRIKLTQAYELSTYIVRLLTTSQNILRNPLTRRQHKQEVIDIVYRTRVVLYKIRDLLTEAQSTNILILQWLSRTNNLLEVLPTSQDVNIVPNAE